MSTILGCE